jgi:hypothetical protein
MRFALNSFVSGKKSLQDDADVSVSKNQLIGTSYGLADLLTDEASSIPLRPSRHCGGRKTLSSDETRDSATSSPVNSAEISEFEASDVSVKE